MKWQLSQRITPFLWFDNQAEEAANFYVTIFDNSKIIQITRCGDSGPGPKGCVLVVAFDLEGQHFTALNGGPLFKFTEAVSFVINCATQKEIDYYWSKLSEGGSIQQCGWLKDRYGLSWQIVPSILPELMGTDDSKKTDRVMKAIMTSVKFDISNLERAAFG